MSRTLIFLFWLLPTAVIAQFTISGRVLDADNARPISNVSVFLNDATIGGKTGDDGVFRLENVKPGKYDLIVSFAGFFQFSESVAIDNSNISLPDIYLRPGTVSLSEVKITSREEPGHQRNLDLFKNIFLGTSELAKECKLINPELLDLNYDEKSKTLTAKSEDFLIIENRALGYRIKYLLSDFKLNSYDPNAQQFFYEGSVLFEEMKGTASQVERWENRRQKVYANTSRHFLRAILGNELNEEGFSVLQFMTNPERPADSLINEKIREYTILKNERRYGDSLSFWIKKWKLPKLLSGQAPSALTGEEIIEKTNKKGLYAIQCRKCELYVIYNKNHQFKENSLSHLYDQNNTSSTLIAFNAPFAFFDNNGTITNPGSVTYTGVWANKRIAELLPVNYEPPQTGPAIDSVLFRKIDTALKSYMAGHYIEKTYLHFDKPYYAAGDSIYFKAYVTDALYRPSILSNILNVELIGPANNICGSVKLKLTGGTAPGDFALADTLKQGNYRIRAYTCLMRNNGEEYFFDQYLPIANAPPQIAAAKRNSITPIKNQMSGSQQPKTILPKIDVQFFPEGGNLINGVEQKIAFKAVAPNGLGVDVKGIVRDEQGQQVCTFASQHLGMGTISITPRSGKRFKATITYADTAKATFDLPPGNDNGYALNADNSDPQNVRISIISGQQTPQTPLYLIAQSGGVIYSYIAVNLVNKKFTTVIPKEILPDGIVQFTLFSANREPVNERLVFIRNPDQLNLKLASSDSVYHARQKVTINLTAKNQYNEPVTGNFSVAVTDETVVPIDEDSESTILSHLLLTSDIRGYVEKPNYYFTDKSNTASDLDALMLTQGYHRFEWKRMLDGKFPPPEFLSDSLSSVSGKITTLGGKPVPYGKVSLLSVSNVFFSLDTVADANGNFVFKHFPVNDSIRYIIQATDKQVRKNTLIEIDKVKPPKTTGNKNAPDGATKENNNVSGYLNFSYNFHKEQLKQGVNRHAIELKEVVIKEKAQKKYLHHSENLNGPGNANDVITADQLPPGSPTFIDAIIGHLHGIQYADGNFYYEFFPTLILLDGIEVQGNLAFHNGKEFIDPKKSSMADILNTVPISDIASVEIIRDASLAAIYGVRGGGGVIIITTKRWDDMIPGGGNFKPAFAYYSPAAFYKARVFYSPKYDAPKTNAAFTDLRTTIYWNPNMNTDEHGNASFEFFNADSKGTYLVTIEGIDSTGHVGRQTYHYRVE